MPAIVPSLTLDSLLGRHTGPRVVPFLPVRSRTLARLKEAGIDALQWAPPIQLSPDRARSAGFVPVAALTWHLFLGDQDLHRTLSGARDRGFAFGTVVAGGNLLGADAAMRRAEALLDAQRRTGFVVHLETHRSALTQSIPRTLDLAACFPELTFNLDLSHWFVTHRLDRHDADDVIERCAPVLRRCRFLHGRVASPDEIQTPLHEAAHLDFFHRVWADVARHAADPVFFAPELLPPVTGYARTPEASDRWAEARQLLALLNGAAT